MINKFEAIGIFACIGLMALALFFMRLDSNTDLLAGIEPETQTASVVSSTEDSQKPLVEDLVDSMNAVGELKKLIIDDVVEGEGPSVEKGDIVSVHYIGTLQNGQQFDNSYVKGSPFTFTVGDGEVIKGWDQGLIGMKEGGQRIVVVPPELAYGAKTVGPIPAHSTLVFAIELISVE